MSFEFRTIECPICDVDDTRVLGVRGGETQRHGQGIETEIHRCRRCGLILPEPAADPQGPTAAYGDPVDYFRHYEETRQLESAERVVREITERTGFETPAILDIGSGRGEIVLAAQHANCEVVGLELSEAMIEAARTHFAVELEHATVEDFALQRRPDSFDAVVGAAVIEHVYDPDSFMAAVQRLLRPGGVLFLDLPREPSLLTWLASAGEKLRGRKAVYYPAPTWEPFHLYGFAPKTIKRLLTKHGFAIESMDVHANPYMCAGGGGGKASLARQLVRLGNLTGSAPSMTLWARLDH